MSPPSLSLEPEKGVVKVMNHFKIYLNYKCILNYSIKIFLLEEEPTSNSYFDKEEIFHNLLIPDDGDQNTEDGLEPFESMMKRMEDISGDKGVWKKILKTGTGSIVPEGSLVRSKCFFFLFFLMYVDWFGVILVKLR